MTRDAKPTPKALLLEALELALEDPHVTPRDSE